MQKSLLALAIAGLGLIPPSATAQPVSDSDFLRVEPLVTLIPDGTRDTTFKVAIMVHTTSILHWMNFEFSFAGHPGLRIDTTVSPPNYAFIKGVTYGPAGRHRDWTIRTSTVDNSAQTVSVYFFNFEGGAEPKDDTLCYLHFKLTGSGVAGSVTLDSASSVPTDFSPMRIGHDVGGIQIPRWTPGVINIFATGDVDCDGEITTTDIIYMVNFMFRQGPAPMSGCQ